MTIPEAYRQNPVGFIALIENIQITQEQRPGLWSTPTGTIVFDENVRIAPVAVTRGTLRSGSQPDKGWFNLRRYPPGRR